MTAPIVRADGQGALDEAVRRLLADDLIVVPTDTVYGVAAHGLREAAVAKLYDAKLRPRGKAIPLLLADPGDVDAVGVNIGALARRLMARYWPGAMTVVIPARPGLPPSLTAGGATVAVRIPDCDVTRALIRGLGVPLAATSANLSGVEPAVTAFDAAAMLGDAVALILDNGRSPGGAASTVVDATVSPPRVLRPGPLTLDPDLIASA
ncbi:MAG: L-threonylcarbamoyladenylate synthase [Anaerolineae bacterium]